MLVSVQLLLMFPTMLIHVILLLDIYTTRHMHMSTHMYTTLIQVPTTHAEQVATNTQQADYHAYILVIRVDILQVLVC